MVAASLVLVAAIASQSALAMTASSGPPPPKPVASTDQDEAISTAERYFRRALDGRPPTGLPLAGDDRVIRAVGEQALLVRSGDDPRSRLVESTRPVAVRSDGAFVPLDLTLGREASGIRPLVAATPITIGDVAADGVRLDRSGFAVRPRSASPARPAVLVGNSAFFAGIDAATDMFISPLDTGAELFWQLRSRQAPEELRLAAELPAGAELRPSRGGVEVVRGGDVLGTIANVQAWDANRRPVRASLSVVGSELVVQAAHRDEDIRYPVLVDPAIEEDFASGFRDWLVDAPQTTGESRCKYQAMANMPNEIRLSRPSTICDELVDGKPRFYAELSYLAPGTTAVTRADFLGTTFTIDRDIARWCARAGIRRPDGTEVPGKAGPYDAPQGQAALPSPTTDCATLLGTTTAAARTHYADERVQSSRAFWTMRDAKATRDAQNADWTAKLPGASVWLDDNDRPVIQADTRENLLDAYNWSFEWPGGNAGWTGYNSAEVSNDSWGLEMYPDRHLAARRIPGTGAGTIWVDSPRVPAVAGRTYSGDFWARHQMSTYSENFKAELVFFNASGAEIGKVMGATRPDTAWPRWRRSDEVRGQAPAGTTKVSLRLVWLDANDGEWHNADAARLEESCPGGPCAEQWTNKGKRVVTLKLTDPGLGPKRINFHTPLGTQTRTHSCAGNRNDRCWSGQPQQDGYWQVFRYDAAALPEGINQLGVSGTDFVGNATTGDINNPTPDYTKVPPAKVDHTPPRVTSSGPVRGGHLTGSGAFELKVDASDPGPGEIPTSGARHIEIRVDGVTWQIETEPAQGRTMSTTWYWDTGLPGLGEGTHGVVVTVTDGVGLKAEDRFTVVVDPVPSRDGDEYVEEAEDAEEPTWEPYGCESDPEVDDYCGEGNDLDPDSESGFSTRSHATPGAQSVSYGLADQSDVGNAPHWTAQQRREWGVNPWQDERFEDLRMCNGRLIVPWNVVTRARARNPSQPLGGRVDLSGDQSDPNSPYGRAGAEGRTLDKVDRWLLAAGRGNASCPSGIQPLISFGFREYIAGSTMPNARPTVTAYQAAWEDFRERYRLLRLNQYNTPWPEVNRFTAWNEPNHSEQPTSLRCVPDSGDGTVPGDCPPASPMPAGCSAFAPPDVEVPAQCRQTDSGYEGARQAGRYFKNLDRNCTGCIVAAGDFAMVPRLLRANGYFSNYRRGYGNYGAISAWAIHPYRMGYRRETIGLRRFARATASDPSLDHGPNIWITEVGGNLEFHLERDPDLNDPTISSGDLDEAQRRAAGDWQYLLANFRGVSGRIRRFYAYAWSGKQSILDTPSGGATAEAEWDSGLTNPYQGTGVFSPEFRWATRPALCIVRSFTNPGSTRACP